jgi:aryl-alcohol dehydrogenase-like predicted oxidoreductase
MSGNVQGSASMADAITDRVPLGWSGIQISPVCIGGMSFGKPSAQFHQWTIGQDQTTAVIKRALDLGVNFIDTANTYSFGTSEEYIGRALKDLGVKRENVVLASKVFFNDGRLSKEAINREIDGTLKRLGTDYLDLYIIHRFDYSTPIEETMEALDGLVKAGKVRALGASEMYAYQLHDMQVVADENGWTKFTSFQPHYNLLYREDERETLPVCRQYHMAITPYSPLASGHLARATWESNTLRGRTDAVEKNKYDAAEQQDLPIVKRVKELADKHGVPMARIALAWLWAKGVTAPIVGCSKPVRVDDAVLARRVKLSQEEINYLEEPYRAHELVGPLARPGEKPLAGTTDPHAKKN